MIKPQFDFIVNLIKDHAVFKTQWRKRQASVEVQLKVALHRFTHDGSLCSLTAIGRLLGVPVGSVVRFTRRCASALCVHITRYIKWPTEEEKAVIREKLGRGNFQDITGVVDGTMIPVFRAPAFGRDSFATRKSNFAMGATGICDHRGVFIFFTTGFTGTRHDSAAYKDTPVYQQKERFFSGDEHLIGDVAYALTPTMITAYKGDELPPERVFFNENLRETRVKIEHAFGWLKGRFRCITNLRLEHTGENDMRRLNQQIMACVVMYNLLKIEDIPHDMSMEDILSDDFLMLPEEEGARVVRVRARRRAAAESDDNGDDDDGRVVEDRPWYMFETDAEEARYEREQRILRSRKRTRLTRAMLNRN